jgi:hypothetical protein
VVVAVLAVLLETVVHEEAKEEQRVVLFLLERSP